jgi:hypothetical protein
MENSALPWFQKDVPTLETAVNYETLRELALNLNLKLKKKSSTCSLHRRKHQKCPKDCFRKILETRVRTQVKNVDTDLEILVAHFFSFQSQFTRKEDSLQRDIDC